METDDWALLSELVQKDHVILTPSQAHDDFYVIDYAVKYDGFIVTNDMFRDHVANKVGLAGMRGLALCLQNTLSDDENDASDDANEDGMVVDNAGNKRSKNIDLSEVTFYKVPRELLPMLHGEGGETMEKFQEYTGTYIVLPSHAVLEAPSPRPVSNVLTLSIYGPEPNRQQAVGHLDAFLFEMQQKAQYAFQHQQQQQPQQKQYMAAQGYQAAMYPQQQFPGGNGSMTSQDDHMMEIDPY
ncbi:unnamed protein product [Phytophthora fragariaefolia]|uniref:Unnamed protein product n=1 Tax=Phytophthora fragariaefolia TaxID=1490495 RepID=A0A9W7DAK6_9STRA|nr:unnamed protein product [Phytophthora fragariaefolia]